MRIIGNAGKAREVQAVASGALSTGGTVVVNSDGTVSVVSGQSEGAGSPTVMFSAVAVIVTSSARRYLLKPLDVSTMVFISLTSHDDFSRRDGSASHDRRIIRRCA